MAKAVPSGRFDLRLLGAASVAHTADFRLHVRSQNGSQAEPLGELYGIRWAARLRPMQPARR